MDHVQKMFMVPQHQLDILKNTHQTPPTPSESIRQHAENDLDREMGNVLNSPDTDVYIKAKRYSAVLQRYLAMVRQKASEKTLLTLTLPGDVQPGNDDIGNSIERHEGEDTVLSDIMKHMPGKHKNNAQHIIDMMSKSRGVVSWTPHGEIIVDGSPVRGTHLFDLLKSVTAPYRISAERRPIGWMMFLKKIADLNIPMSLIPNTSVKQAIIAIKRGDRTSEKSGDINTTPNPGYTSRTPRRKAPLPSNAWLTF